MASELYRSKEEKKIRDDFVRIFKTCPIPDDDILQNLGLFLSSKNLARILFMHHIYQQIIDIHGVVIDFGTRWGQNMSLFSAMRGIFEPFNRHRKIIGFDTFTGFPKLSDQDSHDCELIKEGGLTCTPGYDKYLEKVLEYQEQDNPAPHIKKFEVIKGDAVIELPKYLKRFPETLISLAYFDFDLYEPTKECLKMIRPHLTKGSVLAFDELNDHDSPGETVALKEVFNLNEIKIERYRYTSRTSYFVL